ncbi:hypothetical protein [Leptolyngbya sp. PCC 6406]|uniref:hypothetical protein n=1 Tax=Leptolyngbya sp. PCC 6406 TaxID=1173264 RepID=UPI0002ACD39C|nr:hypothetical protein [Leptolyngbya sp. PCC 6406]
MLRIQGQVAQAQTEEERQARLDAIAPLHQMGLTPEQIAIALNLALAAVEEHQLKAGQISWGGVRS